VDTFCCILDDLSLEPSNIKAGCYIDEILLNHLTFVDDICVLCPGVRGLQRIPDLCQASVGLHEIIFNCSKTVCIMSKAKSTRKHGHPVADTECTKSKIYFSLQIFGDCIRY